MYVCAIGQRFIHESYIQYIKTNSILHFPIANIILELKINYLIISENISSNYLGIEKEIQISHLNFNFESLQQF